jgi:hypothetical protein
VVDERHYIGYVPLRPFVARIIMAGSLKAYAPLLASRLGTTPAALYERQRALVRDGILDQSEGRGPGSGVQVGPYPVALLLVAVLATDSLTETAETVRILAAAKSAAASGRCPLTGESTFVEAIARVLDRAHDHWRKIKSITVRRTSGHGVIEYGDSFSHMSSIFAAKVPTDAKQRASTRLVVNAMLTRALIEDIVTDLKKISESEQRSRFAALQTKVDSKKRVLSHAPGPKSANRGYPKEGKKQ